MSQSSYQEINLTSNLVLAWPSSFTGGPVLYDTNDINPSANGFTITFPDARLVNAGETVKINNVSAFSFQILANDGVTVITNVTAGQVLELYIYNNTTANGLWRVEASGGGSNGIIAFTAASSDNSINITGGVQSPPGSKIDFKLPTSLSNFNAINAIGFPVVRTLAPLTFGIVDLIAGSNINITFPDGNAGDPVINLSQSLVDLASAQIGEMQLTGNLITNNNKNGDLQLNTNGTGNAYINGLAVDINANVTGINNLTLTGTFKSPFVFAAWCSFKDTIVGSSNDITPETLINVSAVTGNSAGYKVSFINQMPDTNYGVMFGVGGAGGILPFVAIPSYIVREKEYVIIRVTDTAAENVPAMPNGLTVGILSGS